MANPLLDRAPPEAFAERRQAFEIEAKVEDFARLAGIIETDLGTLGRQSLPQEWRHAPVEIRLQFGWADVQKTLPVLTGRVATTIAAVCQRCLEPFEMPLATDLDLLLLRTGRGDIGDDGQEVWEIEADTIRPQDLVEEALIMAMPFAALHESAGDCDAMPAATTEKTGDTVRPFADLKAQMDDVKPKQDT